MSDLQKWMPCDKPKLNDILRWNEPLWAKPNKPRGKRDKIGEQQITAELITRADVLEFKIIAVKEIADGNIPTSVTAGDIVKRKKSTLEMGDCQKLIVE